MYDYLIVGAGMYGAVVARELTDKGYQCLVIDKRPHIGGNCYTEHRDGINIHVYGAHIFHTSSERIWKYINRFVSFNNYKHHVIANYNNEMYSLPFNMFTFNKIWGVATPEEAKHKVESQRLDKIPSNLEEQAISLVGTDIYEILIKGYTEKQWGRPCTQLSRSIIKRLPVRYTWNTNYFSDVYQGIPINGYTELFDKLLDGVEVITSCDYLQSRSEFDAMAHNVIYTGQIDELFDYCYGQLEYRTLRFETERFDVANKQGWSVINYTHKDVPYTRTIEHKHFEDSKSTCTYVTTEYPAEWTIGAVPYYPINDDANNAIYKKYRQLADNQNIILGGRLAEYRYYDMDQVMASALQFANSVPEKIDC